MYIDPTEPLSTRIKLSIGLILALLFLALVPARWFGFGTKAYQQKVSLDSGISVKTLTFDPNEDPDEDKIPNWQEALLGTDPTSKNTNDPLETTSIDTLTDTSTSIETSDFSSLSREDQKLLAEINDPNNITGQISKNSAGIATYLNQEDTIDTDQAITVGENIFNEASKLAQAKTYEIKDITTAKTETFAFLKTYGNTVASLYLDTLKKVAGPDDLVTLSSYLNDKDPQKLTIFNTKITVMTTTRDTLLAMDVPQSAITIHLAAINAAESYRNLLYSFSQVSTDPIRALISAKESVTIFTNIIALPKEFATYFDNKNVVFAPKDSGYLFMQTTP